MARQSSLQMLAPVPGPGWLHRGRFVRNVALKDERPDFTVHHPRYFNFPGVLKSLDARLMALSVRKYFHGLVRACEPDIVDAHWGYPDGVAAGILADEANLPYVVTLRGDDVTRFLHSRERRDQMLRCLQAAQSVITVSNALRQEVIDSGVPADRCIVIPNGIDPELFRPESREAARKFTGLDADVPVILSVGRLIEMKGHHLIVRALPKLRSQNGLKARLVIVGEDDAYEAFAKGLRNEISQLGLEDRVILNGPCPPDRMRYWYSAADLFCLASDREGCPNVVLESMACGCPVAGTNVWGTPEFIPRGSGLLMERDVDAIAATLDRALSEHWDRGQIAASMQKNTWDSVASRCLEAFQPVNGKIC